VSGLAARLVLHEVDHLDGILFVDRLSPIKKKLLRGKIKRLKEDRSVY
jgi:peptide deformylase